MIKATTEKADFCKAVRANGNILERTVMGKGPMLKCSNAINL